MTSLWHVNTTRLLPLILPISRYYVPQFKAGHLKYLHFRSFNYFTCNYIGEPCRTGYKTKVKEVEELKSQRIVYEWEHLDQHTIDTAISQWSINKLVLLLKEDSSSTYCDVLSILTVKLLFSFMAVAVRHCVVENNSFDWTLWSNFYFHCQKLVTSLRQIQTEEWLLQLWLTLMQIWQRNSEKFKWLFFIGHSVVSTYLLLNKWIWSTWTLKHITALMAIFQVYLG